MTSCRRRMSSDQAWRQAPGEPWRNGYIESFSGRVRDGCSNINIFCTHR